MYMYLYFVYKSNPASCILRHMRVCGYVLNSESLWSGPGPNQTEDHCIACSTDVMSTSCMSGVYRDREGVGG